MSQTINQVVTQILKWNRGISLALMLTIPATLELAKAETVHLELSSATTKVAPELSPTRYPLPEAIKYLKSNAQVKVTPTCLVEQCIKNLTEARRGILFWPRKQRPKAGLVFYPGGKVDPRAYAPLAYALAQAGVLTIIVPMPDNLAFLGIDRFQNVIQADELKDTEIEQWYLAGHSLGGAIAVRYAIDYQLCNLCIAPH